MFFLAAILLMVALHYLVPLQRWLEWPWRLAGLVPTVAGLASAVLGERRFRRHGTPVRPFEPTTALVTDGVFRYSRNPMYLGLVLVLAGLALLLGTLSPLFVLPLFVWLITTRFVRREEALLEERFGQRYADYRAKVRRWL